VKGMEQTKKEPAIDDIDKLILSLIPADGSKVSRKYIAEKTRLSQRAVRERIHDLIVKHQKAIAFSTKLNDSGYYLILDKNQQEKMYKTLKSYARQMIKRARAIKNMSI
jgi:DNA-binding Lrp family transcriptional regulator